MTGNREYIRIGFFAISFLLILSASVAGWSQGGGREAPKPTPPKPPVSRPATPARKNKPAFRQTNPNIELVKIPSGSFMMGSTNGDANEKPAHQVTFNYSFYMSKYEITQAQWKAVMGDNPSKFTACGGKCPVESVSWVDAQNFISKLNGLGGRFKYRLPTESEWEYACRAGTTGDNAGKLEEMGWYLDENSNSTHPAGQKKPNAWGLYDMYGNVWEWCEDWFHKTYDGAPTDGSAWLEGGDQEARAVRGGSWDADVNISSALRYNYAAAHREDDLGFRVVAVARRH